MNRRNALLGIAGAVCLGQLPKITTSKIKPIFRIKSVNSKTEYPYWYCNNVKYDLPLEIMKDGNKQLAKLMKDIVKANPNTKDFTIYYVKYKNKMNMLGTPTDSPVEILG